MSETTETTETVEKPTDEQLADAIVKISDGVGKLMDGPLKASTIVLLIQNACPS
jgi:hypothetical protein